MMDINTYKDKDIELWKKYKMSGDKAIRNQLLRQFDGLIQAQVNKWAGPVARDVLYQEALVLAAKAIDSYNPAMGAQLSTHITNNLAPLSRIVYTHQNAVRIPENLTLRINAYNNVMEHLTTEMGRTPTFDEIHSHTGWSTKDIDKFSKYTGRDLVESMDLTGDIHTGKEESDMDALFAIYISLPPSDKPLFEAITGYNRSKKSTTQEMLKEFGVTQSQLSYRKTLLTNRIKEMTERRKRGFRK